MTEPSDDQRPIGGPTSVVLLGASVRALASSAVAAGWTVIAVDQFGDRDLRQAACWHLADDSDTALLATLATLPPGPVVYTGGLENQADLLAEIGQTRPIWGCSPAALRIVRSPSRVAAIVKKAGLTMPESDGRSVAHLLTHRNPSVGWAAEGQDIDRSLIHRSGDRAESEDWIWKRIAGSGGYHIRRETDLTESDFLAIASEPKAFLRQRFVSGVAMSSQFLAWPALRRGHHGTDACDVTLLGTCRQRTVPERVPRPVGWPGHEFTFRGVIGPIAVDAVVEAKLVHLARTLVRETGLVGLFGVDWMAPRPPNSELLPTESRPLGIDEPDDAPIVATPVVLEVNPRYTAAMEVLERHHECSFLPGHAAACQAERLAPRLSEAELRLESCRPDRPQVGKAIVYATRPARWGDNAERLRQSWGCDIADWPWPNTVFATGEPIATVFAEGSSVVAIERTLSGRVDQLIASLDGIG